MVKQYRYYFEGSRRKSSKLGVIELSSAQDRLTLSCRIYGSATQERRESMKELYKKIKETVQDYYDEYDESILAKNRVSESDPHNR